uniref:Coenzyme Q-binding protein COQ10 START domain-containing protein n=2 Tax=Corethron hystrix TaxID=216773 RepID=A0A7S1G304_9STRA|mmetsp:Transcript_9631/g.21386  ORF Transcript_9631/g.21386 Transcript_9631/m.21386 type:complete len:147 (+) Transcript_9631:90-530(+)|eukprot:CAMPEP_0113306304 /NCGR_PEP_ID=MMETSP0010_2-20120614/5605_1 /TAXON_ID=216773 ORGANISM="Corethron hystrix, Strain 308" /NCGR_SAMPLE_ID=MMETSP0010_2 /ASSEMBLY_ACC=CAM_ASM_000155 /LENGTH=146 /DNA_ID=CAMNT_0000160937 /DNA_START=45 /DNA_END=485 /DNA_ORIENTATION=- /assembly_acc=CAM_ASM_000155
MVHRSDVIQAPPEAVWSYLSVPKNWPEWDPDITSIVEGDGTDEAVMVEGSKMAVQFSNGMAGTCNFPVAEPHKFCRWEFSFFAGLMKGIGTFTLTPQESDDGTVTKFDYTFSMEGFVGSIMSVVGNKAIIEGTENGLANIAKHFAK